MHASRVLTSHSDLYHYTNGLKGMWYLLLLLIDAFTFLRVPCCTKTWLCLFWQGSLRGKSSVHGRSCSEVAEERPAVLGTSKVL